MVIRIAIASKDSEYLRRLVDVMEKDAEFAITVYSNTDSLAEAAGSKKFDVFMFTEDILRGEINLGNISADLNILLDDEENFVPASLERASIIAKYQRISNIEKQIFDLYSEVCGRDSRSGKGEFASVISFYSPIGGVGKTTLSLMAAGRFAAKGYRTFYINLEDISSESFYLPQSDEKGLSDFMVVVEKDVNLSMKLQGMLKEKKQGLFYLNEFSSPNDIMEMNSDDVRMLISGIKETGMFDVIVVDMGTKIDDKLKSVFELSDRIVLVEKSDEISVKKLTTFYNMKHIINEYAHKSVRIINKDNGLQTASNSDIHIIGKIGEIKDVTSSRAIDILSEDARNDFIINILAE